MKINLQNCSLKISAGNSNQFIKNDKFEIVFSGRSNVGKSSLINTLLSRKSLARVSSTPGKTITINYYDIDDKIYFIDLPGYGFAKRDKSEQVVWSNLVESYLNSTLKKTDKVLIIQLIDSKVGITKDDALMLKWMNENPVNYIIVATKSDKLNAGDFKKSYESLLNSQQIEQGTDIIMFSSLKGKGKDELLDEIFKFIDY